MFYKDIYNALDSYFHPETCTEVFPVIGEQFHFTDEIKTVVTATFASDEVMRKIEEKGLTDVLLFTHHPVQQRTDLDHDSPKPSEYAVKVMKKNRVNLFTYHIPLDRNSYYSPGNNLARALGVIPFDKFYLQNEVYMGVLCYTGFSSVSEVGKAMEELFGHEVRIYRYGGEELIDGKIAIMAGGASSTEIYKELKEKGINTFITGMTAPQWVRINKIHKAAEAAGINIIGGTHYSTEKFAPMRMVEFFKKLGLKAQFIEETPLLSDM